MSDQSQSSRQSPPHNNAPITPTHGIPKPNDRAFPSFYKLREKEHELTARNHHWWFCELDDALAYGLVWIPLFAKTNGTRPTRPTDPDGKAAYDMANTTAATWIKTAAGQAHRELIEEFIDSGDGVSMYDKLKDQFGKLAATSRYFDMQALFRLRDSPMPIIGSDWRQRCTKIANLAQSLRENSAKMSSTELINEIAMHTLIFSLPEGDEFQQRLISNLDTAPTTFQEAREQLIKHTLVKNTRAEAISGVPEAAHAATTSTPSPHGSQALRQAPPAFTIEDLAAAVSAHVRCYNCNGPHFKRDCPQLTSQQGGQPIQLKFRANGGQQSARFNVVRSSNGPSGSRKQGNGGRWAQANLAAADDSSMPAPDDEHSSFPIELLDGITIELANVSAIPSLPSLESDAIADSGASAHMSSVRKRILGMRPTDRLVKLADGTIIPAEGVGYSVFIPSINGVSGSKIVFPNVLWVPSLSNNLISTTSLVESEGYTQQYDKKGMRFYKDGSLRFTATVREMKVATLDGEFLSSNDEVALSVTSSAASLQTWHQRLDHRDYDLIVKLGLPLSDRTKPDHCIPCVNGKLTRAPSTQLSRRATRPLERVFTDVHGPFRVQGRKQERYSVIFQDDYSRHVVLYCVRSKSDVFQAFKDYVAWSTNQMNTKKIVFDDNDVRTVVKALRDDKGGEYTSREFDAFCAQLGIQREHTIRDTPQQNGPAERFNRTLTEGIATLLNMASLPASAWVDAASAFVHVHNRLPSKSTDGKSPFELFHGVPPDFDRIRTFGCEAWVHLQRDQRSPLLEHAVRSVFIGYPPNYSGWRFINLSTGREFISNSAIFIEDVFPGRLRADAKPTSYSISLDMFDDDETDMDDSQPTSLPVSVPVSSAPVDSASSSSSSPVIREILLPPSDDENENDPLEQAPPPPPPPPAPSRPSREERNLLSDFESHPGPSLDRRSRGSRARVNYAEPNENEFAYSAEVIDEHDWIPVDSAYEYVFAVTEKLDPRSLADAMSRADSEKWMDACHAELKSLLDNGTWEIVPLPPGKTMLGNKWVFKTKRDATGNVERYKVRLVAKGFLQKPGRDYDETFAPTGNLTTLRTVIALATELDWELKSLDISTAFLNGDMDTEVYMDLPEGMEIEVDDFSHLKEGSIRWALQLVKALYGLKQAGRRWSVKLHTALTDLGFVRTQLEPSCYLYEKAGYKLVVPVYVDDLTMAAATTDEIKWFVEALAEKFKLVYKDNVDFILGIAVERDRTKGITYLSQTAYIEGIVHDFFGTSDVAPVTTPLPSGMRLTNDDAPKSPIAADVKKVQEYTGKLLYLQRGTRPDIAYALHQLCRFTSNPGPSVLSALAGLIRYINATKTLCLTYKRTGNNCPQAFETFADSDHGGDPITRRSTGGFAILMCSGAVNWSSKLQKTITLSSTEAEYINASITGCDMIWQRGFLDEIGFPPIGPSPLYVDSNSAASVLKNPEHQSTMKQVDRRYHWVREKVSEGEIEVKRVAGSDNPADIFTKPLARAKFTELRAKLGLAFR